MRHPNPQILVYIAIADAYLMAVEYVKRSSNPELIAEALKFERYLKHPHHGNPASTYTDDAEMSIANAHVLLNCEPPYTPLMFADAYMAEFHRGGIREGYARGFQAFLQTVKSGQDFLDRIRPTSEKNGAAMRAPIIGVLPSPEEVLRVAALQASLTHDTPAGIYSAQAVALMSHFTLYEDLPLSLLDDYLITHLGDSPLHRHWHARFQTPWTGMVTNRRKKGGEGVGINTVHAVYTLLTTETTLMGMLRQIIEWGGDTDSVGAIAWGIASSRMREELPSFLAMNLEHGRTDTGPIYLYRLGLDLMEKYDK